ncbi:MAG: GxxExxY protein [Chloroflexi bacterium]|nr:GxxExxY protein [Chloroflexota bacterium]
MDATLKHAELTDKILFAFFKKVYHHLGYGYLEQVYENAMAIELRRIGLQVEKQAIIDVYYEGENVGEYRADLLVEGKVIVELKAAKSITDDHEAQLLNYLRATPYEVGLLLNFGPKPDFRRKAFDNERKTWVTWISKIVTLVVVTFITLLSRFG